MVPFFIPLAAQTTLYTWCDSFLAKRVGPGLLDDRLSSIVRVMAAIMTEEPAGQLRSRCRLAGCPGEGGGREGDR